MSINWTVAALLAGHFSATHSLFDGTWLIDSNSIDRAASIETFSLSNGIFSRGGTEAAFSVKADGDFHIVPKNEYIDEVSIRKLGKEHWREMDRLAGQVVYAIDYFVSKDGDTMTARVIDFGKPDHKPIPTTIVRRRLGQRGKDNASISGIWQTTGTSTTRDHLTQTMKLEGDRFSMIGPGGYGFEAVVGGPRVPVKGDTVTSQSAITMPDDRTILDHRWVNGIPTITLKMTVLPDGKTIKVEGHREKGEASDFTMMMYKQF